MASGTRLSAAAAAAAAAAEAAAEAEAAEAAAEAAAPRAMLGNPSESEEVRPKPLADGKGEGGRLDSCGRGALCGPPALDAALALASRTSPLDLPLARLDVGRDPKRVEVARSRRVGARSCEIVRRS